MKQRDFVAQKAQAIRNGEIVSGHCSSVYAEGDTLYSYGKHYPLLYPVTSLSGDTVMVCNRKGYSMTTSKHIGYASTHADVYVYEAVIPTAERIITHLRDCIEIQEKNIAKIKRKDTQKEKYLREGIAELKEHIAKLS